AALEAARRPFLERGREAAKLTTPSLLPPDGHSGLSSLPTPYQGVGARGVNTLANKLLLAQFPPNTPFFRLTVDETALAAMGEDAPAEDGEAPKADAPGARSEASIAAPQAAALQDAAQAVETALGRIERAVMAEIETGFVRAALHAALRHLIVSGNCLLHLNPEGGARVFRLDRYVVKRDALGGVREIVLRETVAPDTLPEGVDAGARGGVEPLTGRTLSAGAPLQNADRTVDLYTWIRLETGGSGEAYWSVVQEALGQEIPGSAGRYPKDRLDWLALRWTHVDGEDYGRGHVEEYLGDLRSLEGLMQAIVEGSAAASRMTVLVSPNGQTDAEELAEAENGAIIDGDGKDVSIVQANKFNDFRVAFEAIKMLNERLSFAFLLNSAVKRDADYVTAEEVRFMAAELEDALGGVYSVLAEELQKPLVSLLLHHKAREGLLPPLPLGVVRPRIVTGLDALGRGRELQRLEAFVGFLGQVGKLAETPLAAQLDLGRMLAQASAAIGVHADALIRPTPLSAPLPTSPSPEGVGVDAGGDATGVSSPAAPAIDPAALAQLAQRIGPMLASLQQASGPRD
ncbi:MAG: portal protein, partial [Pseudomonadota bacterium]